jgi:hypothetical protein
VAAETELVVAVEEVAGAGVCVDEMNKVDADVVRGRLMEQFCWINSYGSRRY